MRDYFVDTEFLLQRVWLDYQCDRYHGRGIVFWKPREGFHMEVFLDPSVKSRTGSFPVGELKIVHGSSIRMSWGRTSEPSRLE